MGLPLSPLYSPSILLPCSPRTCFLHGKPWGSGGGSCPTSRPTPRAFGPILACKSTSGRVGEEIPALKATRGPTLRPVSPQIKQIMNGVFRALRGQFELEESYTGRAVLGVVMNTIKVKKTPRFDFWSGASFLREGLCGRSIPLRCFFPFRSLLDSNSAAAGEAGREQR